MGLNIISGELFPFRFKLFVNRLNKNSLNGSSLKTKTNKRDRSRAQSDDKYLLKIKKYGC